MLLAVLFLLALFLADSVGAYTATLTLELGGQRRAFRGPVVNGTTVMDALNASVLAGNISLGFSGDQNSAALILSAGDQEYVAPARDVFVSVNGRRVDFQEISRTLLRPRDEIIVRIPLRSGE